MTLNRKVLIVGEQPTERYRFANQPALGGQCTRRLVQLMDLKDEAELRRLFDMENLFRSYGHGWDAFFSREKAVDLASIAAANFLVLCGPRVQAAFQVDGDCEIVPVPMLTRPTIAACIPHPSGRVRAWKDEATVARVRIVLKMAKAHAQGHPYVCVIHKGAALHRCGCT